MILICTKSNPLGQKEMIYLILIFMVESKPPACGNQTKDSIRPNYEFTLGVLRQLPQLPPSFFLCEVKFEGCVWLWGKIAKNKIKFNQTAHRSVMKDTIKEKGHILRPYASSQSQTKSFCLTSSLFCLFFNFVQRERKGGLLGRERHRERNADRELRAFRGCLN